MNMSETPEEAEKSLQEIYAEFTPFQRLQVATGMFQTARELIKAGILYENPDISPADLRGEMFMRLYGDCYTKEEAQRIVQYLKDTAKAE